MNRSLKFLAACTFALTSSLASAANSWIACQPTGVMEHPSRIHVRCAQATGGIFYYAIATSDKERANRFQSLGTAALLGGRTLWVNYETTDTSGTAIGCGAGDCRLALMMEMR